MKLRIFYIFYDKLRFLLQVYLGSCNKQSDTHNFLRVWHLHVNLFASGAVLKLLCSVNCYHPIQEDAAVSLEYLAIQEMPCLQK